MVGSIGSCHWTEKPSRLKVFRGSNLTQSTDLCTDLSFGGKSTHLTITSISTRRNTKQHTRLYFEHFQLILRNILSNSQNWNRCILCHDYRSIAGSWGRGSIQLPRGHRQRQPPRWRSFGGDESHRCLPYRPELLQRIDNPWIVSSCLWSWR